MQSMPRRTLALTFAVIGLFFTTLANALGLGEIMLKSSLNEPLDAEIRLLEVRDLAKSEIVIQLASREAFQRAGVERAFFLNSITFEVDLSNRSAPVIRLQSTKSVVEPYLNFLLEVQWPSGRLLREYTLLMDLPVFDVDSSASAVAAPKVQTTVSDSAEKLPQALPKPVYSSVKSPIPAAPNPASERSQSETKRVADGDTLWEIALQARPDQSVIVHQGMLAIQRANPEAFINGNINLLRTGEILRIPSKAEMLQLSTQQAISEVARQNQQWLGDKADTGAVLKGGGRASPLENSPLSKPTGRLKLSAIDSDSTSTAKVSGAGGTGKSTAAQLVTAQEELDRKNQENTELSERIEQLESQVETMEKLIAVSNDKLRALQLAAVEKNQLSNANEMPEIATATVQTRGVGNAADIEQPESSSTDGKIEASVSPESSPVESTVPPSSSLDIEPERGVVDTIKDNIAYIAGAIVALLFFIVLLMRFRNKDDDDELDEFDEIASADASQVEHEQIVIEEQSNEKTDNPMANDGLNLDDSQLEGFSDDNVDAIDKANIFISLGQYDQAEKQLLREIEANPDNIDARLSLLEVYSETKNINEFDLQYAQLLPMGDFSINEKAKDLRDRIPGVDEFDVSNYGVEESIQPSVDDQLDNSRNQQPPVSLIVDDEGDLSQELDLDFSDLDKEFTQNQPLFEENQSDNAEITGESRAYSDDSSIEEKEDTFSSMDLDFVDSFADEAQQSDEKQEEYSINVEDDLADRRDELDYTAISGLDSQHDADTVDRSAATEQMSLDEDDLNLTMGDDSDSNEPASIDFNTEDDTGLDDHVLSEPTIVRSETPRSNTQSFADSNDRETLSQHSSPDEVDMASLDREISSIIDDKPVNPANKEERDNQFGFDEDLNTLDDSFDEVATKLDLALAYLDMGDSEGANDILSEVIEEGTPEQQEKARGLLNDL